MLQSGSESDVCRTPRSRWRTIQPGVEPAARALALRNPIVIQQRDNARHNLYIRGQADVEEMAEGKDEQASRSSCPHELRFSV